MDALLNEIYRLQRERDKATEEGRSNRARKYDEALNIMALAKDSEMEARKTHD